MVRIFSMTALLLRITIFVLKKQKSLADIVGRGRKSKGMGKRVKVNGCSEGGWLERFKN